MRNRVLATILLLNTAASGAAAAAPTVKLAGESEYELKQSFVGPDRTAWLLVTSGPKHEDAGGNKYELRRLNGEGLGAPRKATELLPASSALDPVFSTVGKKIVAAVATRGAVAVFRFDSTLTAVDKQTVIQLPNSDVVLTRVTAISDTDFLILGRRGRYAWMARLTVDLDVVWNRPLTAFRATVLYDAAVSPQGALAIVGASVNREATTLWIAQFAPSGEFTGKRYSFAGVRAQVIAERNGFVMMHDARDNSGSSVSLQGFSPDLAPTWSLRLAERGDLMPTFGITAGSEGTWVAAFDKQGRAHFAAGRGGEITWQRAAPQLSATWERVWNVGRPVITGSTAVFPYTLSSVNEQGELRQIVVANTFAIGSD